MKPANGGEPAPNGGLSNGRAPLWLFAVPLVFYILGAVVGNSKLDQLIDLPSFRGEGPLIWKVRSDYIQGEWMGVALLFMVVVLLLLYLVTKNPLAVGNIFMGGLFMGESAVRALVIHARASNLYEPGGIIMPWQTAAAYRADPLLGSLFWWVVAVNFGGLVFFVWWWKARQKANGGEQAAGQVAPPAGENQDGD